MNISQEKLKALTTSKLKFMLGVGRAGLKEWKKGRQLEEIKKYLAVIEEELKLRGEDIE